MKFKISTVYTVILFVMLASQALILVGLPFGAYAMVSVGAWSIMLCEVLALIMLFADGKRQLLDNNRLMMIAILALLSVCVVILSSSIDFDNIIKLVTFLQLPTFLFIATRNNTKKLKEVIYAANLLYPVLFFILYLSPLAYRFVGAYGEIRGDDITLGYNNPNETALYLMFCFFILLSAFFYYKNKLMVRFIAATEICFLAFLIYKTDCRAVLVVCMLVFAYMLFSVELYVQPLFIGAIFIIPIIYTIIVVCFPSLAYLEFMGETIENGRMNIILEYIDNLDAFGLLFGNFEKYNLNNMHNGMLSVVASLGIVVFGVYFAALYFGYKRILCGTVGKRDYMPLALGMLGIILHSIAEAAPLVSGSVYAASIFMIAYLAVPDKETNGSEEIENITH